MVNDFNNRIESQRKLLHVVNSTSWPVEQLFSLSDGSIRRWILANSLEINSKVVVLVFRASEILSFLANMSQEQITSDYQLRSQDFSLVIEEMRTELFKS
jgi:hypothetical protein